MECNSSQLYSNSSCSGNGYVCNVPDVGYICNFGWTSQGDFSFSSSGPDCLINYLAVRIMSYFCIIIPSISNILIIGHYISKSIRKKSCRVISRAYKSLFPFCFLITGLACSIYGILKLSHSDGQQPLVGRDVSISLIVPIFLISGYAGIVVYLQVIIISLKCYSETMPSEINRERVSQRLDLLGFYSWFIIPTATIFGILPLISIGYPSQSEKLCMACLIGSSIINFVVGAIFCKCLSFLIKELNVYIESIEDYLSKDLKVVVRRLNTAYIAVGSGCVWVGTFSLIFGVSNFLFHLTTYYMLFLYTSVPPMALILVITVTRVSQSDNKQIIPVKTYETV